MSLSMSEMQRVVAEATPLLSGGRLENVWDGGPGAFVLTFYAQREKRHLEASVAPRFARLHLVGQRPEGTGEVSPFVRVVRETFRGRSLVALEQAENDRVVVLTFGGGGEVLGQLVLEMTGRASNAYVVGANGRIVATYRTTQKAARELRPGSPYTAPEPAARSEAWTRDRFQGAESYSEAVEAFYRAYEGEERLLTLRQSIGSRLRAARKRTARLVANLEEDVAKAEDAGRLRTFGELLKMHLKNVPPRATELRVPNLFEPDAPTVEIPLRPDLDAGGNMRRYFRRYKKLSVACEKGAARLAKARADLDGIEFRLLEMEEAATVEALEALAAEVETARPHRRRRPKTGPARFVSADGLEIVVGRTRAENDQVTFHIGRGNDTWVHVEGYTGSHVVVRVPKGKTVPKESLLDAATLAVHFSQLRRAGGGPVAYCACKNVSKPRGAGPGSVIYAQSKTLHVTVERTRMDRLMGREA
ncbi:fibronectin-binding domain-containing protein [bacterium]|nr:fibronectin-binding domain-containing protein [bacterium]